MTSQCCPGRQAGQPTSALAVRGGRVRPGGVPRVQRVALAVVQGAGRVAVVRVFLPCAGRRSRQGWACGNRLAGLRLPGGSGRREGDVDGQAAAGPGLCGDGGVVGGGDGLDDGQAQAVAAVAAGEARAEPLEGLEQAIDVGGRDDRPGAGH
jgi:hypothetical protein